MWWLCFVLSIAVLLAAVAVSVFKTREKQMQKQSFSVFNALIVGVVFASVIIFWPIHSSTASDAPGSGFRTFCLAVFNTIQIFSTGCEFAVVTDGMVSCPESLNTWYQIWVAILFIIAPVFTFGFILSLFKNLSAFLKYVGAFFADVYVFSELNERSLALARDIKKKKKNARIVFADVFESNEESVYEMIENAKRLGAILFKKDILVVNFGFHSPLSDIHFFTVGVNETENLTQTLKLIEAYRERKNTHVYLFSIKVESELLLASLDKGYVRVRRINEVRSLIYRNLYDNGIQLFMRAKEANNRNVSAVVVGMGNHGTEMVKALAWYCQMDGYTVTLNAFDKDKLARDKFVAIAPELMSKDYNGVIVEGEAQYTINVHSGYDVETASFVEKIRKINDATYVLVALGNDELNIKTAVRLREVFEQMKIHPTIQAIVYNTEQKNALDGVKNWKGQSYDIGFIGDMESSYAEDVVIDTELERAALAVHLKYSPDDEEAFWAYEYNYRSSMASAIHKRARILCGISGADKKEEDLTVAERYGIEVLEHRRWNAYMRAEGYVYSGSKEKSSRNDLAKMHNCLVDYTELSDEYKRLDSKVATD